MWFEMCYAYPFLERLAFEFEQLRSVRGKKVVGPTCEVWRQGKVKEWSKGVAKGLVGDSSSQGRVEIDEGEEKTFEEYQP